MSAVDDPAAEPSSDAARADQSNDELEDWLSDLRTEVAADSSEWMKGDSAGLHPADRAVEPSSSPLDQRGNGVSQPSSGGRHRAAD